MTKETRYWYVEIDYEPNGLETPYPMTRDEALKYLRDTYDIKRNEITSLTKWTKVDMYYSDVDIF